MFGWSEKETNPRSHVQVAGYRDFVMLNIILVSRTLSYYHFLKIFRNLLDKNVGAMSSVTFISLAIYKVILVLCRLSNHNEQMFRKLDHNCMGKTHLMHVTDR